MGNYGRKLVSKEAILEKINEFDIFRYYIPTFKQLGVPFLSCIRQDKNPTCKIGVKNETLWYRDFAEPNSYTCFDYVARLYNVNFYQALEIINRDFNLNLVPTVNMNNHISNGIPELTNFDITNAEKLPTEIKVKRRNWTLADKRYWFDKYGISIKDLEHFNVSPIQYYWINGIFNVCEPVAYSYYFGKYDDGRDIFKIYQPYANKKNGKWLSNCKIDVFQGYDQLPWLGEILFITKSLKDVIVLYKLGFPAIAPHGESYKIDYEFMQNLRKRFKRIIILYDNDTAGIKSAEQLAVTHQIPYLFFPDGTKDASDYVEKYGYDKLKQYLNKHGIYSNNS